MARELKWWQHGPIYQLVVPSFLDSNDDGFGDLGGVLARLDYLKWLGARALWLSPIHPSPFRDLGYDVCDYCAVDPRLGTLQELDELLMEAHRRDIAIILDCALNHTSREHPWFAESSASRENPKRDWYIWRDPAPDGSEPNNWISVFGGSVWEWHEPTHQYYLHTFHPTQPDLNWRNAEVEAAMMDAMRFWLDRGVDGLRIDACCLMLKDEHFRDNPPNPGFQEGDGPDSRLLPEHTRDQPGLHELLARIRDMMARCSGDRALLGELYLPLDKAVRFYGSEAPELDLPLHMRLTWTDWSSASIAGAANEYQAAVNHVGWPATLLSTHDCLRLAARVGGSHTRVAAMLLLTMRGTPILYYGEEIGMRGVPIPPEQALDPQGRRTGRNRDPARTPMQWNGHEPAAGFTTVDPWLPLGNDVPAANVLYQSSDPHSLLSLYRRLIALRRETPALAHGEYVPIADWNDRVFGYRRTAEQQSLLVALNFSDGPCAVELEGPCCVALSTRLDREGDRCEDAVELRANEGLILTCV